MSYRQTLAAIKISSANESHILASRIDGVLRRIEASSDLVVENASLQAMAEVAARDNIEKINHHLKVLARYFPEILGHLIFNAEGILLFSSDPTIHPSSIADRAYFQQIKEHPQTGIQFSENLDAKTTNKPIIVAYRAILGDRKEFLGIIATPVDLGFFEKLFAELDLGAQGMVSIRRSDNSRLVGRWPDIQERRNNEAKHIPPQQHIEKGVGDGVVRYMGKTDGVDRIFAFHKIPSYPFYVLIGRAVHEQFAEWYKIAVTTVLLTFLALLLIGFFLHSLTKRQSSLQKSEAQYQAIVENQHDAVCRWLPETTLLTFANEIIKEAVTMLRASLPTTITIEQDIAPDAGVILADPTQLHQILMNLGTNAFHAMEMAGGILSISLHQKTLSERDLGLEKHMQPGNYIQLAVRDSGVGIAPEIRGKIFDPYFTTKAAGKGTGMGLAMVHGIVQSYGGSITCDSQVGEGTVFHITLPVAEAGSIKEKECTELIPVGREHILLIDDEQMLAEMSKAMLERLGYRVTSEKNSIEALVTFRKQPQLFNLMITDQTMPGMTGIDLARLMLQIRPGLPIILCTGYSTLIAEEKAKSLGINGFALKPVTKEGLGTLVRRVLDGDTITG